jgi:hypothetical protein
VRLLPIRFQSQLAESAWQSVTKVLKLPIFGTCTPGFLPTQPPTHLIPEWNFRGLVHILSRRLQKFDWLKVLPVFFYSRFGQSLETPNSFICKLYYVGSATQLESTITIHRTLMSTSESTRPITYFDVTIGDKPIGRIIFSLYNDLVPKTAENFRERLFYTLWRTLPEIDILQVHYARVKRA